MSRSLLVLGGSSGIGRAVARLAEDGDDFNQIETYGLHDFDVQWSGNLQRAIQMHAPTDVVYSVGVNILDWIQDSKWEDFQKLMNVNVWGFIETIKFLDSDQIRHRKPNVVAVTSDAAWRPMRTSVNYCASKAALEMAVRVASREYAPKGWRINAVAPGKVADTPMTEYVDRRVLELRGWTVEAAEAIEIASTPLGRKVTVSEVAEVILSTLNGPAAQTGEIIAVNGGR